MLGYSMLVSLASLLVSFFGFANQLILAKIFGVSIIMDTYLIGASIPLLVSGLVAAALSYSLVPTLFIHKGDEASFRKFAGLLLITVCIIAMLITSFGYLFSVTQIEILGKPLSSALKEEAIIVARISWLTSGLMIVMAFLTGIHNARSKFLLPIFLSMFPFLTMMIFVLMLDQKYGSISIALGLLFGFVLILPLLLIQQASSFDLSLDCLQSWRGVLKYLSHTPLIILAMLCFTVFQFIDAYWAPRLGVGNLAFLGYSQRILVALGTFVIAGPSVVILPRLAKAYADGKVEDLLHDALRAVRVVIACALPAALLVGILANSFVKIIFERGLFDRYATEGVAEILPVMLIGMVAMLCVVMIFRAIYAMHDIAYAAFLGILLTALYFVLSGFFSQKFGLFGIALAYAFSWWIIFFVAIKILWRGHMRIIFRQDNLIYIGKIFLITLAISVTAIIGKLWISDTDAVISVLTFKLAAVISIAAVIYLLLATWLLKIDDIALIYKFFTSKLSLLRFRPLGKSS